VLKVLTDPFKLTTEWHMKCGECFYHIYHTFLYENVLTICIKCHIMKVWYYRCIIFLYYTCDKMVNSECSNVFYTA